MQIVAVPDRLNAAEYSVVDDSILLVLFLLLFSTNLLDNATPKIDMRLRFT